jgi:cyclopropane fatty-acyl-phospholipid synthase-like methyltransferase
MQEYNRFKNINDVFFNSLLESHKKEHSGVGYSEQSHLKRFKTLLDIGPLEGRTILDVGSGMGSFYGYLVQQGINAAYTGYDINQNMVEYAQKAYPDQADRFKLLDLIEEDNGSEFDFSVSVGPMNLLVNEETNYGMTLKMLDKMFEISKIGCAFSMTSSLSRKKNKDTFYYDPVLIMRHVGQYCNNYRLDHSYLPHDFTIFCYKDDFYSRIG